MDIKKLMQLCEADVGYKEGTNNDTKFGVWYGLNHQPWCAMSASNKYYAAGMINAVAPKNKPKGFASCAEWLKYLTNNHQLVPVGQARAGDIIFYDWQGDGIADHVGTCKGNNTTLKYLNVYEGNTSSGSVGSQSNGDGYYLRKRSYATIMAVARPKEPTV